MRADAEVGIAPSALFQTKGEHVELSPYTNSHCMILAPQCSHLTNPGQHLTRSPLHYTVIPLMPHNFHPPLTHPPEPLLTLILH